MPNRLAHETSPYLLQHADNPVDWYPWGPEALARAKAENKPILLSIGYAACHWCHVMAHESFADAATAALMNERFINIKVDREERPDIDGIYMQAVQAMTGHGGWPMTVFLTPEGVPYYGGTYFPPEDRHGMPSFRRILTAVSDAYHSRPADVARTAASVREMYDMASEVTRSAGPLNPAMLDHAYRVLSDQYDEEHGGFNGAPKFPQVMSLDFLLRYSSRRGVEHALNIVKRSFAKMARGGIYDQIGGGFARYSVDDRWLVPHFEKMLYDNALLVRLGAHLWQATKEDWIRRVVDQTIGWVEREMIGPDGGFCASLDADSEGHEGKFYIWAAEEFDRVVGADAPVLRAYWGVTDQGNFEGMNILSETGTPRAIAARFGLSLERLDGMVSAAAERLLRARATRVRPARDDKVLASWNGLMVRGIADVARAFDDAHHRALAIDAATFLQERMIVDGRVMRSFKDGRARIPGYLEDYASLGLAFLSVYELTFDERWLDRARAMSDATVRWFWDDGTNAFHDTASDHETLITRPREITDNATPSGTSLAVELLIRLSELSHDVDARRRATHVIETIAPATQRYPLAFGNLLAAADLLIHGALELALVGDVDTPDFRELSRVVAEEYLPSLVLAGGAPRDEGSVALLNGRGMRDGRATAYVCHNYACDEPTTSPERLREQLLNASVAREASRT